MLASCDAGTVSRIRVADRPDLLEGDWRTEDEIIAIRFATNRVGHFASLDWDEGRFTAVNECEFVPAAGSGHRYASVRIPEGESGEPPGFVIVKYAWIGSHD